MPDLYRLSIDLPAQPVEVYAFVADPATSPLVSRASDVLEVTRDGSAVKSFKTKRGTVTYVTQAPPHFLSSEYQLKRRRERYDIRVETLGESKTRLSIDVNIQPQSLRAKLQGPLPRLGAKGRLGDWVEQAQKHFNSKK
jgi:hypothetical protein